MPECLNYFREKPLCGIAKWSSLLVKFSQLVSFPWGWLINDHKFHKEFSDFYKHVCLKKKYIKINGNWDASQMSQSQTFAHHGFIYSVLIHSPLHHITKGHHHHQGNAWMATFTNTTVKCKTWVTEILPRSQTWLTHHVGCFMCVRVAICLPPLAVCEIIYKFTSREQGL